VTESVEQELQLEKRLTPKMEFYVDTEPVLTAVNSLQLLEMKGLLIWPVSREYFNLFV